MALASPADVATSGVCVPDERAAPDAAPGGAPEGPARPRDAHRVGPLRLAPLPTVLLVLTVLAGMAARLWPRSALWLDEAQTVAFAREPLTAIPGLLRTDGAPPLYYLLLHGWMRVVGSSDHAVRALSVLFSLVTVPVVAVAVRRLFGRRAALVALVLLLTNPFAIRYATETRMYALVVLLVSLAMVVVPTVLQRRSPAATGALALLVAALLWTHYWALYLLAASWCLAVVQLLRTRHVGDLARQAGWRRVTVALTAGGLAWLPWYPSWRLQWERTGTPWSRPAAPWRIVEFFFAHAGGWTVPAIVSGSAFIAAVLVALAPSVPTRWARTSRLVGPGAASTLPLVAVVALTAPLAFAGARISGSAAEGRYTAVLLPFTIALVAAGVARLRDDRAVLAVLAVLVALATPTVLRQVTVERTPAREVAALLAARAEPGDLLVICPEQLGPALARELAATAAADLPAVLYPGWSPPERIDWVGYADRYRSDWPAGFAAEADRRAGSGAIWLFWSETYATSRASCRVLAESLRQVRPGEHRVVEEQPRRLGPGEPVDRGSLARFAAVPPGSTT